MTVRVLKADGEVMRKCSDLFFPVCVVLNVESDEAPYLLSHSGGAERHRPGSEESYQEVHGAKTTA